MAAPPLALQLYTLREVMASDFEGVVRKVAEIGYAGVEPAGYPGTTVEAAAGLFRELGLGVPSAHLGLPVGDNAQQVIDDAGTLGTTRLISGRGAADFETVDGIKAVCDAYNEGAAAAAAHGLAVGYHNHWWEYLVVPGESRRGYEFMLEFLDDSVFFEIDTYWVATGGADPVAVLKEVGERAPVLHIKDGPADEAASDMVACGSGTLDFPAISEVTVDTAEWWIVELDRCATDMMTAVADSHRYLTGNGLASGA
jgi:sugar phosphate isomerase/epimerase